MDEQTKSIFQLVLLSNNCNWERFSHTHIWLISCVTMWQIEFLHKLISMKANAVDRITQPLTPRDWL